jgi:hypothetical protein
METSSRVLGEEHPGTLTSMANLASTLKAWSVRQGYIVNEGVLPAAGTGSRPSASIYNLISFMSKPVAAGEDNIGV